MIELRRVNGEALTLKFSEDGTLSSARFCGGDVTEKLRFIRESDYVALLRLLGFRDAWDEAAMHDIFPMADRWGRSRQLVVFDIERSRGDTRLWRASYCVEGDASVLPKLALSSYFREGGEAPVSAFLPETPGAGREECPHCGWMLSSVCCTSGRATLANRPTHLEIP